MFDNSTSTLASSTISLTNVFVLMEDQNYTINISFSVSEIKNVIQNFISFGKLIQHETKLNIMIAVIFDSDTYGVQSLDVTDTSEDTIYIVCLFSTFSTDSGCTVVLVSTTDQQQQYEGTFNKMDDNTASGNITGVVTGVYNIRAFDQGSNVVAVELLNITITGEPFSNKPNSIPTSTIEPNSTDVFGSTVVTCEIVSAC